MPKDFQNCLPFSPYRFFKIPPFQPPVSPHGRPSLRRPPVRRLFGAICGKLSCIRLARLYEIGRQRRRRRLGGETARLRTVLTPGPSNHEIPEHCRRPCGAVGHVTRPPLRGGSPPARVSAPGFPARRLVEPQRRVAVRGRCQGPGRTAGLDLGPRPHSANRGAVLPGKQTLRPGPGHQLHAPCLVPAPVPGPRRHGRPAADAALRCGGLPRPRLAERPVPGRAPRRLHPVRL